MKVILVRVCSWFAMIIFSLISIVVLIEDVDMAAAFVFFMCLCISATGWHARKFGSPGFKSNKFSKLLAIFSLVFGILFMVLIPILSTNLFGFDDSFLAIRNLLILFLPVVISSTAILISKPGEDEDLINNKA